MAERLHGVETGGVPGRVDAEADPDREGDDEGGRDVEAATVSD